MILLPPSASKTPTQWTIQNEFHVRGGMSQKYILWVGHTRLVYEHPDATLLIYAPGVVISVNISWEPVTPSFCYVAHWQEKKSTYQRFRNYNHLLLLQAQWLETGLFFPNLESVHPNSWTAEVINKIQPLQSDYLSAAVESGFAPLCDEQGTLCGWA